MHEYLYKKYLFVEDWNTLRFKLTCFLGTFNCTNAIPLQYYANIVYDYRANFVIVYIIAMETLLLLKIFSEMNNQIWNFERRSGCGSC